MAHDGNVQTLAAVAGFQGFQTIVQIPQGLREAPDAFTAGFHTAGVVVGKDQKAVAAEHFDFLHVGAVTAAEAVVKDQDSAGNGVGVMIEIPLQFMAAGGGKPERLLHKAGEISGAEIMGGANIVTAAQEVGAEHIDDLFFKQHGDPSFLLWGYAGSGR